MVRVHGTCLECERTSSYEGLQVMQINMCTTTLRMSPSNGVRLIIDVRGEIRPLARNNFLPVLGDLFQLGVRWRRRSRWALLRVDLLPP